MVSRLANQYITYVFMIKCYLMYYLPLSNIYYDYDYDYERQIISAAIQIHAWKKSVKYAVIRMNKQT